MERPGLGEGPPPPPPPDPLSIELHVWQTGPTALEDERTPQGVRGAIDTMSYFNPEVTFEYLDDDQQRNWVVEHMTPEVVSLYDGLPSNVMRADLWRYMVVATEGGLYLDSDARLSKPARYWDVLNPANGFGCEVVIGMENDTNMCQWAILSLVPRHPLLVHAVRFILSRIALHAELSNGWMELLRLPNPREFVHDATGPTVWTEAIVDFFDDGAEDWKWAREQAARNGRTIDAAEIMGIFRQRWTTIKANNVKGYAVPTSSGGHDGPAEFLLPEARTSGPRRLESNGNVCFFSHDFMNSRLVSNGFMSQWGDDQKGSSNVWESWILKRWELGFLSEVRAAFRHLDTDGDGKLTVAEIFPAQGLVGALLLSHNIGGISPAKLLASLQIPLSQGEESEPVWSTVFGLPRHPYNWCDIHKDCGKVNTLHLELAGALSDPTSFLQKSDLDLDGALSFEELNRALDEVVAGSRHPESVLRAEASEPRQSPEEALDDAAEGKGQSPEPIKPLEPPEFPQQHTGGLWDIDTGDYSGLAGLLVAAHDIIDPDYDFADSFDGVGSSAAWLLVAAGALGFLAGGFWCAKVRLARRNGHGRRGSLKTTARELEGGALPSRTAGSRSIGATVSRRYSPGSNV